MGKSLDVAVGSALLSRPDHQTRKRTCAVVAGASRTASGAVSRTAGTDDTLDHPKKKSQRGGGGLCEKVGGAVVARAQLRRTVSLRAAEEPRSEVLTAARASDRAAPQRRSDQRHAATGAIRTRTNASHSLAIQSAGAK